MSQGKPPSREVPVEIVREGWNQYDLEDGTTIRARFVVSKAVLPIGGASTGSLAPLGVGAIPVVVTFAPASLKTTPAQENPTPAQLDAAPKTVVKVVKTLEQWNYYRVDGVTGALKIKMVLTSIHRAEGLTSTEGEPVYQVNSSLGGGAISEDELKSDLGD